MSKLKVALLYGGRSVEHGVSINSARNISEYIDKSLFEVFTIGISKAGVWHLTEGVTKEIEAFPKILLQLDPTNPGLRWSDSSLTPDVVFPVLHGTDGEDGSIQGLLKAMDLPMVGTGVPGSAMSMSKLVTKKLLGQAGLPVAPFRAFHYSQKNQIQFGELKKEFGLPFMVKAASLGSSVGVSKVKSERDFDGAIAEGFRYDDAVLIEQYIKGREIECAILGNDPPEASLPGEIVISKNYEFYTFDAKYVDSEAVRIDVPAKLPQETVDEIRKVSVAAYQALHCEDFARIDLFLTDDQQVFVNEINTIPGFTNSSMYPMMWKERGIGFTELISKLIHFALERHEKSKRIDRDYTSALKF